MKLSPAEFERLALEQIDLLYRVARRLSRDPNRAEDLVQETFLRALRSKGSFNLEEFGMKPWLLRILYNLHVSRSQREGRQPVALDDIELAGPDRRSASLPIDSRSFEGMDEELVRAIDGLSQEYQSVLGAEQATSRPMRIERAVIWQRAAAAIIVLGLTGLIFRASYERRHPVGDQTLLAMVKTHDRCCKDSNAHRWNSIPQNDFVLMGQNMASRIKEPVLATDIGDGWTFVGAAMCWVGDKQSAHLVYRRNGQWLSIFSIPASSCERVRDGGLGCQQIKDHMVAGFARTGGVYCMVGS